MFIYLHAKNQHHRSNRLGEMNPRQKKVIFTRSHPCVAVQSMPKDNCYLETDSGVEKCSIRVIRCGRA